MPTKQTLIENIDYKEVKVTDARFNFGEEEYTLPAAFGVCVRRGTAYVSCGIKAADLYTVGETGHLHKMHGPVSQATWNDFVPPPAEIETAKKLAVRIDIPKGYEWAIVNGAPMLVPIDGKPSGTKKKRALDESKYPVGTAVTYMQGAPGKTTPGDTGLVVGYQGNQLVIEYKSKGRVVAQPGSRHRVG